MRASRRRFGDAHSPPTIRIPRMNQKKETGIWLAAMSRLSVWSFLHPKEGFAGHAERRGACRGGSYETVKLQHRPATTAQRVGSIAGEARRGDSKIHSLALQ